MDKMSDKRAVYDELRLKRLFCDAVFRVDGVEFHTHKVIMCECSPYFRALFTHWSNPDCRIFDMFSVSPDIMRIIIEYAYTGFVAVTPDNVKELFIAADHLSVEGIAQACTELLEKQMDPQNCLSIWRFTEMYYCPELNRKALLCALHHFEEIVANSEEFLWLSAQELATIIEYDELNVKEEKTVYEAVLHWIAFAPEQRKEYAALLLCNVRLALMTPEYITAEVITNQVVMACKDCQMIILKALEAMVDLQTMGISGSVFNNLARPRLPSAFLLAVGGWSDGRYINSIEAYNVNTESWVSMTNNGIPRAYHGVAFLDGSLYCVGGFDDTEYLSTVHRFDLNTHTWHEVGPMHSPRCFVSVTVMDGCIYAIGGSDGINRLKTAERYDPRTNQWTLIAPMHEERSDADCTVLHDKLYICGGFNGTECLSTAECYDPKTNQWTLIAPMDERRSGVGVIAYADHVFAVGGNNGTARLRSVEAYNPYTNTWQALPPMLGPRSNFGLSVINDRLYAAGGFNGFSTTYNVECFDAKTGAWSNVHNMGISRSALSCCVVNGLDMAKYATLHSGVGVMKTHLTTACSLL